MTSGARSGKRRAKQDATSKSHSERSPPLLPKRGERQSQFTLQMRETLHRELAKKAFDSGMTMRGFIMKALRKAGLNVTDADLIDRRRRGE